MGGGIEAAVSPSSIWTKLKFRLMLVFAAVLLVAFGCIHVPAGIPPQGTIVDNRPVNSKPYTAQQARNYLITSLGTYLATFAPNEPVALDCDAGTILEGKEVLRGIRGISGTDFAVRAPLTLRGRRLPTGWKFTLRRDNSEVWGAMLSVKFEDEKGSRR